MISYVTLVLRDWRWVNRGKTANSKCYQSEVINMYQIYSLLTIIVLLWGITMWASIPEEEEDRRY